MDIRVTKGEGNDRLDIERGDGSCVSFDFPNKGPVPHDITHLFVERGFAMPNAFWGMVGRGVDPEELGALAREAGHASAKRAEIPDEKFVQIIQAERMVEAFEADLWSGGGSNSDVRAMTASGCEQSCVAVPHMTDQSIDQVRDAIAKFRSRWASLTLGQSLQLQWTDPVTQ